MYPLQIKLYFCTIKKGYFTYFQGHIGICILDLVTYTYFNCSHNWQFQNISKLIEQKIKEQFKHLKQVYRYYLTLRKQVPNNETWNNFQENMTNSTWIMFCRIRNTVTLVQRKLFCFSVHLYIARNFKLDFWYPQQFSSLQ